MFVAAKVRIFYRVWYTLITERSTLTSAMPALCGVAVTCHEYGCRSMSFAAALCAVNFREVWI